MFVLVFFSFWIHYIVCSECYNWSKLAFNWLPGVNNNMSMNVYCILPYDKKINKTWIQHTFNALLFWFVLVGWLYYGNRHQNIRCLVLFDVNTTIFFASNTFNWISNWFLHYIKFSQGCGWSMDCLTIFNVYVWFFSPLQLVFGNNRIWKLIWLIQIYCLYCVYNFHRDNCCIGQFQCKNILNNYKL